MKTIRTAIPYACIVALCAFMFVPQKRVEIPPLPPNATIYDTALRMLQEFVINCQDTNLGFTHPEDVLNARIDTKKGIPIYYLSRDSILHSNRRIDTILIDMHRRIYPVYLHDTLRACITFSNTNFGYKPVVFDDSNVILTAIRAYPTDTSEINSLLSWVGLIEAPFVHTQVAVKRDAQGLHFLPSKELRAAVGSDLPSGAGGDPTAPIGETDFVNGIRRHFARQHPGTGHR